MNKYKLKIYLKSKKNPFIVESVSEKAIESTKREFIDKLCDNKPIVVFQSLVFSKDVFSHIEQS